MNKILLFSLVLVGCVSPENGPVKSQWAELDQVERVNCAAWPLSKSDLGVEAVVPLEVGDTDGLIASVRLRTNRLAHYYAPFAGKVTLDPDDFSRLNLGEGAVVLGAVRIGSQTHMAVMQQRFEKAVLELRSVPSNEVVAILEGLPGEISTGSVLSSKNGFWLLIKHHEQHSSLFFVRFESPAVKSGQVLSQKLSAVKFEALKLTSLPVILQKAHTDEIYLVNFDSVAAGKGRKDVFSVGRADGSGQFSSLKNMPVKVESEVESFSAFAHQGQYYLGYIDGDSMVGKARLRVSRFVWESSPVVADSASVVLEDVHVSDPIWIPGGTELSVGVLKWVDEESTLASYKVQAGALVNSNAAGIFQKGSRITGVFGTKNGQNFLVMRSRETNTWKFRLCHLKRSQK